MYFCVNEFEVGFMVVYFLVMNSKRCNSNNLRMFSLEVVLEVLLPYLSMGLMVAT